MKAPDMKSASMELDGEEAEDFLQMVADERAFSSAGDGEDSESSPKIVHDEPMTPQDKSVADAWLRQQTNKLLAAFDSYNVEEDTVTVSYDYIGQ